MGQGASETPERVEGWLAPASGYSGDETNRSTFGLAILSIFMGLMMLLAVKHWAGLMGGGGIKGQQLGIILDGDRPALLGFSLETISRRGTLVGKMTHCVVATHENPYRCRAGFILPLSEGKQ